MSSLTLRQQIAQTIPMNSTVAALLYTTRYSVASLSGVTLEHYGNPPHEDEWYIVRDDRYLDAAGKWRVNAITFYLTLDDALEALSRLFSPAKLKQFRRGRGADTYEVKAVPGKGKCPVRGCRRKASYHHGGICSAHYMLRWRRENPERAAYNTLRDHARERRIEFTITFDYFCGLVHGMRYLENSGTVRGMLTIDRHDPVKGYIPGNLGVVSVEENVAKGNCERHLPEHVRAILSRRGGEYKEETNEQPF